jgi:hypothetical protein
MEKFSRVLQEEWCCQPGGQYTPNQKLSTNHQGSSKNPEFAQMQGAEKFCRAAYD